MVGVATVGVGGVVVMEGDFVVVVVFNLSLIHI